MSLTTTPAVTTEPELTDELAEVLAAVLAGTIGASPSDSPAAELTAVEIRRAERTRDKQNAALSVLRQLGYVHPTHDGGWFLEHAGREALAARDAAKEAARVQALRALYAAAVAELHNVADALDAVAPDGLAELTVELKISTKLYARTPAMDAAKIATVDAIALAVLGRVAKTEAPYSGQEWMYHKAEERRGPVLVNVSEMIADPKVHERESEVERLRAELADVRAALALIDQTAEASGVAVDNESDASKRLGEAQRAGMARLHHAKP